MGFLVLGTMEVTSGTVLIEPSSFIHRNIEQKLVIAFVA